MCKTTFGSHIHYVLKFLLIFLTLSLWSSADLFAQISIAVDSKSDASCPGASDGSINITVNGGTPGYTYDWSDSGSYSNNVEDISGLTAGTYTIVVTDSSTPSPQTSSQEVTINDLDNIVPTISAPTNIQTETDTNDCNASAVILGTPSTSDNCGVATVTNDAPTDFPLGETIITWTVTDNSNNTATATQKVTVVDNTNPTISAPADIQAKTDSEDCNASGVTLGTPTTSDNCGVVSVTNDAPADFPLGETIVTWTVTDDAGNTNTATQSVTVTDITKPLISAGSDIVKNNDPGKCEAIVNISAATATDNCSVPEPTGTRDDGLNLSDPYPVGSTIITWSVTDVNGNTADPVTQTVTINDNEAPVLPTVDDVFWGCTYTVEAPVTTDNCSGNITGTTTDPLTYSTSGTYYIDWTFTDTEGNFSQLTQKIIIDELKLDVSITNVKCNGFATGSATATATGGVLPYTYSWTNLGSGPTKTDLAAGTYNITVTDGNGCQVTQEIVITEPDALSMNAPSSTEVTCYGGSDGSITVGAMSGGSGNYEYSIDNNTFTTNTTFTGLEAGNYAIFVKDENGCSLQKDISITQPNVLNASLTKTNIACYGENTGNITVSAAQGGHGNYEYSIDGSTWQSTPSFDNLYNGNYTVYIRDADKPSCIVILNDNYTLTQPTAELTIEVTTTRTNAYGSASGSATANPSGGTPGYTYAWRETGSSEIIQTTKTATNLLAGEYEVTITDTKGCTITESVTVIDAIEAFIASRSVCEDEGDQSAIRTSYFEVNNQTAVGGVGPYTYAWEFGEGATNPARTGIGEHTVYYSSTGNKTVTLVVTDSTGKTFTITQQNYVGNCYEPCGKSENFVFDPNNIYIGDVNGNALSIGDQALCDNSVDKFIYIAIDKSANAYNPYIELIYKISNTNTAGSTFVAYAGGCRSGDDIDDDPNDNKENKIGEFIKLTLDPIDFECGDNLDIENFYVTWTNVEHKKCGQNNNAFCYSQDEPVMIPTPLSAVATPTHILCKGDSTGSISTSVSGGYAPYSFNLTGTNSPYQDSKTFQNLPAGEHTVYVRDSRGNTTSVNTTILEPSTSISANTTVVNPACYGELGEASVTAEGGTPFEDGTYEYLWNDPAEQTTATATDLPAGEYTVTVIDANGCQTISTVTITEPEELSIAETGEDQVFSCGVNSTNLDANTPVTGTGEWTVVSGTGGILAEPSNPNSEFTGASGSYTLKWTISHPDGTCATTSDMSVTFDSDCSTLDFDGIDDYVTMGNNYPLSSGSFSIEVWVKPKSVSGVRTVLSKRDYSNINSGGFDLIINNGAPTFRWGSSSVSTSSKVKTDRWYHLAVIYKNSNIELYVDGIKVGNSSASNPAATAASFLVGAIYDSATPEVPKNYFQGWIEELRIWNTALSVNQLRFMMNQRLVNNGGNTKGEVLPMDVPNLLSWSNLQGYYRLMANEISNGETPDIATNKVNGILKNIETSQENTAPLPYISNQNGSWRDSSTWLRPSVWDVPNGIGINGDYINWNIARISHDINSTAQNIHMLGLLSESGELLMDGDISNETGQGLTITHYLKLDGTINLEGESQLVQTEGSILDENSSGYLERDQQGTANSFNYNYWTSPVSLIGFPNNSGYKIKDVLLDGTNPNSPQVINFNYQYHWADHNYSGGKRISSYWLHTFQGTADNYFEWHQFSETDLLNPGIGYSMKGTTGYVPVSNRQNYVFKGKPNNGDITVAVGTDQNLLTGNPYPSAIDAHQFIQDNLSDFNGSLYFWDHFGPVNSHYLEEYIGGYAVYNLSGGISSASSIDSRIDNTGEQSQKRPPGKYIPVGQAFFINTIGVSSPNSVTFKNKYRAFVPESSNDSHFHMQETPEKGKESNSYASDNRFKIRLKYKSPKGYHRQILVTADANTTGGFDLGYDAPLIEDNVEDMYWMIDETEFVIQAVPHFNTDQVLPIGIKISETGEYTIKVDELENLKSDFKIYLRDKANDIYYDLGREPYEASTEETGSFNDRYEIVFKQPEIDIPEKEEPQPEPEIVEGTTLGLQYLKDSDEISIINPDLINVDYVELYSISGQLIKTFKDVPTSRAIILAINQKLSSAVYLVRVYSGEKLYSKKVIITK